MNQTSAQQGKVVFPKESEMEIITINSTLHEKFAAQLAYLRNTYPQKRNIGTGTRIFGKNRTCEKMVSCSMPSKQDFMRMIWQLPD